MLRISKLIEYNCSKHHIVSINSLHHLKKFIKIIANVCMCSLLLSDILLDLIDENLRPWMFPNSIQRDQIHDSKAASVHFQSLTDNISVGKLVSSANPNQINSQTFGWSVRLLIYQVKNVQSKLIYEKIGPW